jgi:uncharacterized protein YjiS (DUF1127 family)
MLLMTFATKSLSSVSAGVTRVAAFSINPFVSLAKALIHRREVLRLGELDERSLKDIGLVRSDLDGALAVSWLSDPTLVLAERSATRSGVATRRREASLQLAAAKEAAAPSRPVVALAAKPPVMRGEVVNSVACSA